MNMRFKGLCRGHGKIFFKFQSSCSCIIYPPSALSKSLSGIELPCSVYAVDEFSFALAVPTLNLSQKIIITQTGDSGEIVGNYSRIVLPRKAKWESRFNYKIKPKLTRSIRNIDAVKRLSECHIEFIGAIPNCQHNIVRAKIVAPPGVSYEDLHISCIDSTGNEVLTEPVLFGEALETLRECPMTEIHYAHVAFKMPLRIENYCFAVDCSKQPHYGSFSVLEDFRYQGLLEGHAKLTESAQTEAHYSDWLLNHIPDQAILDMQRRITFPLLPKFSFIVPLYKTPLRFFLDMVDSVENQTYVNWELIFVNASPEDAKLALAIEQSLARNKKFKHVLLNRNMGISDNTNKGIEVASGDFICFFDHDDVVEPNLLFEYVSAINQNPETDLLYCDEDKLLEDGKLCEPFFKSDFNIDLLRNNNYICHLLSVRKTLLDNIGFLNAEYDGAQDHDLALRACEQARHIYHVSKILYHWRVSENSTALSAASKPYAAQAGISAVRAHLARLNILATVEHSCIPFSYDVTYHIPDKQPLVSILIPNKDNIRILECCLTSIEKSSTYKNYEIVIIENNSVHQETFAYYKAITKNPRIKVITYSGDFNFSAINNFGVSQTSGEYLIMLNNDTEVISPDWIERMLGICQRSDVGAVGVKLLYPDDTIQHAGLGIVPTVASILNRDLPKSNWGYFGTTERQQDFSAVTAACLMTKRSTFDEVEGMTESLKVAFNDIDFCLKLRKKGLLIVYTPSAQLYHFESFSRGSENTPEKMIRFNREISYMQNIWAEYYVNGDPYINKNFKVSEPYSGYFKLS